MLIPYLQLHLQVFEYASASFAYINWSLFVFFLFTNNSALEKLNRMSVISSFPVKSQTMLDLGPFFFLIHSSTYSDLCVWGCYPGERWTSCSVWSCFFLSQCFPSHLPIQLWPTICYYMFFLLLLKNIAPTTWLCHCHGSQWD